jgi:glycosyltransferase involved in cell wall biosynthesis
MLTIDDLPAPPAGKTGWPWTSAALPHDRLRPVANGGPRITIVTPSYNQGDFIEETIRSILLQHYPDLEYIIMDAGSSDRTVDIIAKYAPFINHWESRWDRGQAHAINKGLALGSGEIFNWINSDDVLEPGALHAVAGNWVAGSIVAGAVRLFSTSESTVISNVSLSTKTLALGGSAYAQPGVWLDLAKVREIGDFDETYHYGFDRKHLLTYLDKYPSVVYLDSVLAGYRLHEASKTMAVPDGFIRETRTLPRDVLPHLTHDANIRAVDRYARLADWYAEIGSALDAGTSRLPVAVRLVGSALRDPSIRFNRALMGALFRVATGRKRS